MLCLYLKAVHKNQLHPSLGHPENLPHLEALCQAEIKRQKDQADGVHLNTQMLQVTVKPLHNMNLDIAFGKDSRCWIHFSSPSKVNWKMFSVLDSPVHISFNFKLCIISIRPIYT